jgi:hypothetical protein
MHGETYGGRLPALCTYCRDMAIENKFQEINERRPIVPFKKCHQMRTWTSGIGTNVSRQKVSVTKRIGDLMCWQTKYGNTKNVSEDKTYRR